MYYARIKREKVGRCNMCAEVKDLSWDHVPPKGGIELTAVEIDTVFQILTGNPDTKDGQISQNGVKYRTICKECNSLIGRKYDPVINEFSITVARYVKSVLALPKVISHRTRPTALMRGILGHLAAAKADFDEIGLDVQVREFIFDDMKPIPDGINIFYWIYPYNQIVIMRDVGMLTKRGSFRDVGIFHMLKYFPVAYLVTNQPEYEGLLELTQYRDLAIDEEVDIPIQLGRVEHPQWPEMVDDRNILFGGQSIESSVSAHPRGRKVFKG